jgi:retron-type reverse transcriptase
MSAQGAMNVRNKVSDLQSKLSHAAKESLDRRFGALYDKIYREDVMLEAWKRVKANKGGPGVDGQDLRCIEDEIGIDKFLKELREELKNESYRPLPVLRCYIDKPGKPEKRPLGIPIIKDRVCQMAGKLVIEPIFEANFLESSHGFRPEKSAHDRRGHCRIFQQHPAGHSAKLNRTTHIRPAGIKTDTHVAGSRCNGRGPVLRRGWTGNSPGRCDFPVTQ